MNKVRFENRTSGGAGPVLIVDGLVYSAMSAPAPICEAFAARAPRASLIAFALWNDRNACVTDRQMKLEYGRVATDEELRETVRAMLWDI